MYNIARRPVIALGIVALAAGLCAVSVDPAIFTKALTGQNEAASFAAYKVTERHLRNAYVRAQQEDEPVRILVVPGHEARYGGAEYKDLKERDMAVMLAKELQRLLEKNKHFDVILTRDENSWKPFLAQYFSSSWSDIKSFVQTQKQEMNRLITKGQLTRQSGGVIHNTAPDDVALRIYGINKWANDNNIDLAVHIHFNDVPRFENKPGKYQGFAIYVPEEQFNNAPAARDVADSIAGRLSKYMATSTLPKENGGVVESQHLIAVGSYNTSDAPSILIEYGYIYEKQFENEEVREMFIKDLAYQTYLGLRDFFGWDENEYIIYDTLALPYVWRTDIAKMGEVSRDTYALQAALLDLRLYPPKGKNLVDCPLTGSFGACTRESLENAQEIFKTSSEDGTFGPKTRKVLNDLYMIQPM